MKDLSNYKKEKYTIDMSKANMLSMLYFLGFAAIFGIPYYLIWGLESKPLFGTDNFWISGFMPIVLMLIGVALHELVHGIFFAAYAEQGFRSVRFGFMKKYLAPYAHCKEPLKIKNYVVALLAPLILVGIIPALAGVYFGSALITFVGVVLCTGATGDLMIYQLIRKENPENYVQDHPTEAGYYIFRKIQGKPPLLF